MNDDNSPQYVQDGARTWHRISGPTRNAAGAAYETRCDRVVSARMKTSAETPDEVCGRCRAAKV